MEKAARGTVVGELKEQVALYLDLMRKDSGVEMMKCNRYSEDAGGAKVVATRRRSVLRTNFFELCRCTPVLKTLINLLKRSICAI